MLVQMILITKPGYQTRALAPMTETWARRLETMKVARRATPEEIAELEAAKAKPAEMADKPAEVVQPKRRRGRPRKQPVEE